MSDDAKSSGRGKRLFGLLVLASAVIGAIAAGRQVALNKADQEFEERLRAADANRD